MNAVSRAEAACNAAFKAARNAKTEKRNTKPDPIYGYVDYNKSQKLRPTPEQIATKKECLRRQLSKIKHMNPTAYKRKNLYRSNGESGNESSNDGGWGYLKKPVTRNRMRVKTVEPFNPVNNARRRRTNKNEKRVKTNRNES